MYVRTMYMYEFEMVEAVHMVVEELLMIGRACIYVHDHKEEQHHWLHYEAHLLDSIIQSCGMIDNVCTLV